MISRITLRDMAAPLLSGCIVAGGDARVSEAASEVAVGGLPFGTYHREDSAGKAMPRQATDFDLVRAIGAALPDVKDASGPRGTALKVKGRLLACEAIHKSAEPNSLMVRIGPKRREALLAQDSDAFYLTDHYAPYPAVLVRLSRIKRPALKELLTESWEFVRE